MVEVLNGIGQNWGLYFGAAVIQNTVFLGLILVVLHFLRNRSAGVRYVVASIGLLKLLLPPFIPLRYTALPGPIADSSTDVIGYGVFLRPLLQAPGDPTQETATLSPLALLFLFWFGIAALYLAASAASTFRLALGLRGATPVADDFTDHEDVHIYRSPRIGMPLTLGIFPRGIFVPVEWDAWSPACRRAVVRHEMAHIRRHDGVFQALQILAQSLYFFHPLVRILNRRISEYREMACDDLSAGFDARSRIDYSRSLLEVAESAIKPPLGFDSASTFFRRKRELLSRVHYQTMGETMSPISKNTKIVLLATLAALILPLSWYTACSAPDEQTEIAPSRSGSGTSSHMRFVEVVIEGDDAIRLDGKRTTLAGLATTLEKLSVRDRDRVVIQLGCSEGVAMDLVFDVQTKLRELELNRVSYATGSGKQLALILPSPENEARMKTIDPKHIATIRIGGAGEVLLEGDRIEVRDVRGAMHELLAQNDKLIVSIRAHGKARYEDFVGTLDQVKMAGAQRIYINDPEI